MPSEMKYWVYSGYRSSDNYDADRPIFTLVGFATAEEVFAFRKVFEEGVHDECIDVFFRVIKGVEVHMRMKEVVVDWEFS